VITAYLIRLVSLSFASFFLVYLALGLVSLAALKRRMKG